MSYVSKCLNLERNDLAGSVDAYRHAALHAPHRVRFEDDVGILYMLNDDGDALDRRFAKVAREPAVAAALLRLGFEP